MERAGPDSGVEALAALTEACVFAQFDEFMKLAEHLQGGEIEQALGLARQCLRNSIYGDENGENHFTDDYHGYVDLVEALESNVGLRH